MSRRDEELKRLIDFLEADDAPLSQDEVREDLRALGITEQHVAELLAHTLSTLASAKRAELERARERMEKRRREDPAPTRAVPDLPKDALIERLKSMPNVAAFFRKKSADEMSVEELRSLLEDYIAVDGEGDGGDDE